MGLYFPKLHEPKTVENVLKEILSMEEPAC